MVPVVQVMGVQRAPAAHLKAQTGAMAVTKEERFKQRAVQRRQLLAIADLQLWHSLEVSSYIVEL